ncbi:OsmC family protein [Streptomyces xanthochromogenes]|uniref:OsmC family protein n=1 Tax=Streptomyces xanthochromogenes TaxID=67384 RepID=UPI0034367078
MRNGFNIASSGEFVNEIREDAQEARFFYHAGARFKPGRGLRAWTDPAVLGRVKSARRFELDLADGWQDGARSADAEDYTPLDLALAAVGVCSLKTAIAGGSARGINFDSIEMVISAFVQPREDGAGEGGLLSTSRVHRIAYDIQTESDADAALIDEVTRQILDRSPNHRTVKDRTDLHFSAGSQPVPWSSLETAAGGGGRELSRRVKWISGTQFESTGTEGCLMPLRVDEAKQFAGVDWAPNPQEYVVLALAAELASLAARRERKDTGASGTWTVNARGLLDLRGLMLVDPDAAVGFQEITCTVEGPSELEPARIEGYFRAAVEESALVELLALPHPVEVQLTHTGSGARHQ